MFLSDLIFINFFQLRPYFDLLDKDKDGYITFEQLMQFTEEKILTFEMQAKVSAKLVLKGDTEGNTKFSFEDFKKICNGQSF